MRKVKIIKSNYGIDSYEDTNSVLYPCTEDWEEVNDTEYEEIRQAVAYSNLRRNTNSYYMLIEYSDEVNSEVFRRAANFVAAQQKEKELLEKRKEDAKLKREEKNVERKRKQLEKLKKELGE